MKKRIFSFITALALTMALFPSVAVPASAATHTVSDSDSFHKALAAAQDGDIIQLTRSFVVKNPVSNDDSLVIDKAVTIQGGSLTLWYAGILLGADVTFKDITLGLASNVRNAIMANGHTLTLENVQRDPTARHIHLFCGGQTGTAQGELAASKQGDHGQIVLKGNTNLGLANIYAGSISTDGQDNVFEKSATVTIEPSVKGLLVEHIYACGALQTPVSQDDWIDVENEIAPPTPSTKHFPVSGEVTLSLYQGTVKEVDGGTGTSDKYAKVTYNGSTYLNDSLVLTDIGGLTVSSGNLVPANGSSFAVDSSAPLGIAKGAILGLQKLGNEATVGDLTGGGALVLGQSQTLTVAGTVTGTTTVGIGGIFNGHSLTVPNTEGHTYIDAPRSVEDSFTLAAPASRPDIKLVKDGNGAWTAAADEDVVIVNDFTLLSAVWDSTSGEFSELLFQNVKFTSESTHSMISYVPLEIKVNTSPATRTDDNGSYRYTVDNLELCVTTDGIVEALSIISVSATRPLTGSYTIEVTVPAANSGTGQPITRTASLTVKAAGGGDTVIPVPSANTGLVYTGKEQVGVPTGGAYVLESGTASATNAGSYTAKVKPADGFTWAGGGTDAKPISWSIAKADNFSFPTGLGAAAPTAHGASDGKLTGTTAEMEYANNPDFTGAKPCANTETTGLTAGDYYVRIAESGNYKAGPAVLVTVPQDSSPIPVTGVTLNKSSLTLTVGRLERLAAAVVPSNAAKKSVTWTSSDTAVAAVDASGNVTAVSAGTATITVTTADGAKTASCAVTVQASSGGGSGPTTPSTPSTPSPPPVSTDKATDSGKPATEITARPSATTQGSTATAAIDSTTGDEIVKQAEQSKSGNVVIAPEIRGDVTKTEVTIPASTVGEIGSRTKASLMVSTPVADVTIPNEALSGLSKEGGNIKVTAERTGTAVELSVTTGSKTVDSIPGGVTVTVPVEETKPGTVAVLVHKDGTRQIIRKSSAGEDGVTVPLDGSAKIEIVDNGKVFADVPADNWAADAVAFASAHELFNGTTPGQFSPDLPMSRGMLAVVLHNLENNPAQALTGAFGDVDNSQWYAEGVAWAADNGIVGGYGNGQFGPDDDITREQLAVMLWRYAGSPAATDQALRFADADKASNYALDALRWAVENGVMGGKDGSILDPAGKATRAETAQMLKNFLESK